MLLFTPVAEAHRSVPPEAAVCTIASDIGIARVSALEPTVVTREDDHGSIYTAITADVVYRVHGAAQQYQFWERGGRVGRRVELVSDVYDFRVADLWLLILRPYRSTASPGQEGVEVTPPMVLMHAVRVLDPSVLPPLATMEAIYREHCTPSAPGQAPGPTVPFLPSLPGWILDWCQHY